MFIARYERTMRNAKPKGAELKPADTTDRPTCRVCHGRGRLGPFFPGGLSSACGNCAVVQVQEQIDEAHGTVAAIAFEPKTPAREIISRVGALHGYTLAEITGPRLEKKLVQARFDAIKAVADGRPDMSLPQIGRVFNRDHTSILHALNKRGGRQNRERSA